jgi:hypothetical protein
MSGIIAQPPCMPLWCGQGQLYSLPLSKHMTYVGCSPVFLAVQHFHILHRSYHLLRGCIIASMCTVFSYQTLTVRVTSSPRQNTASFQPTVWRQLCPVAYSTMINFLLIAEKIRWQKKLSIYSFYFLSNIYQSRVNIIYAVTSASSLLSRHTGHTYSHSYHVIYKSL